MKGRLEKGDRILFRFMGVMTEANIINTSGTDNCQVQFPTSVTAWITRAHLIGAEVMEIKDVTDTYVELEPIKLTPELKATSEKFGSSKPKVNPALRYFKVRGKSTKR